MNLTQIKAVYTNHLNEKLTYCFDSIEREMVANFHKVQQGIDFIMSEKSINQYSNDFPSNYKDDMIKVIKERYADNWDVTYISGDKKNHNHFVFHYKGEQAGFASHIVHRDTIIVNKDEPVTKRTQILDLSNG